MCCNICEKQIEFTENYFKYARRTKDSILIGDWNILLNENMSNKEVSALHKQKIPSRTLFQ